MKDPWNDTGGGPDGAVPDEPCEQNGHGEAADSEAAPTREQANSNGLDAATPKWTYEQPAPEPAAERARTGRAKVSGVRVPVAAARRTQLTERTPRLPKRLKEGSYIYYDGHMYMFEGYEIDPDHGTILHVTDVHTNRKTYIEQVDLALAVEDDQAPIYAPTLVELNALVSERCSPPPGMPDVPGSEPDSICASPRQWEQKKCKAAQMIKAVRDVEAAVGKMEDQAFLRGVPFKGRTDAIKAACERLQPPITFQTYYMYSKLVTEHGYDEDKLAAALVRSAERGSKMPRALFHFLDIALPRFIRKGGNSPTKVYKKLAPEVLKRIGYVWPDPDAFGGHVPQALVDGLLSNNPEIRRAILANPDYKDKLVPVQLPSLSWFYAYCRWFRGLPDAGEALITKRYGKKTWEEEHLVWDTFVHNAQFSRQYVFADHYLLDLLSVDEATRGVRFRMWLTLFIDAYSRAIVGMSLHYEDPSIESIQTGIRNMMLPKTYIKALGIDLPWISHGLPLYLFLDNAWAHHSGSLESLAYQLSQVGGKNKYDKMELVHRPPHMARYGAIIEALFGNVRRKIIEELAKAGAIRSSKPEDHRNASKMARLLYEDVYRIIHELIVEYMHTPHSGLGDMVPHNKWLEGIAEFPVEVPPAPPEVLHLFLRKAPYTRKRTDEHGIRLFGLEYTAPWLEIAPAVDAKGNKVSYDLRYDPADISKLELFVRDRHVGTVYAKKLRLADGTHRPLSLVERKLARNLARKFQQDPEYWVHYLDHVEALGQTIKVRAQEQRKAHQIQLKHSTNAAEDMLAAENDGLLLAAGADAAASRGARTQASSAPYLTVVPGGSAASKTGDGKGTGGRKPRLTVVPGTPGETGSGEGPSASLSVDASVLSDDERMRLSSAWTGSDDLDGDFRYDGI